MYGNPNAVLVEVATSMALLDGNVKNSEDEADREPCWTEYYTEHGYDVYLFNYAGYGRSFGNSLLISNDTFSFLSLVTEFWEHCNKYFTQPYLPCFQTILGITQIGRCRRRAYHLVHVVGVEITCDTQRKY